MKTMDKITDKDTEDLLDDDNLYSEEEITALCQQDLFAAESLYQQFGEQILSTSDESERIAEEIEFEDNRWNNLVYGG